MLAVLRLYRLTSTTSGQLPLFKSKIELGTDRMFAEFYVLPPEINKLSRVTMTTKNYTHAY